MAVPAGCAELRQAHGDRLRARSARGPAVRMRGGCLPRAAVGRGCRLARGQGTALHPDRPRSGQILRLGDPSEFDEDEEGDE